MLTEYTIWLVDDELRTIEERKFTHFGTVFLMPIILQNGKIYKKWFPISSVDETRGRVIAYFSGYRGDRRMIKRNGKLHNRLRAVEKEYIKCCGRR